MQESFPWFYYLLYIDFTAEAVLQVIRKTREITLLFHFYDQLPIIEHLQFAIFLHHLSKKLILKPDK